ncbi:hypothetical protein KSC_107790 [Ktedonobacter sp. SOSP1-52]|nr:hypothetical protein KSC_107790 [Ktedonobacter sp. SOSP1-52]
MGFSGDRFGIGDPTTNGLFPLKFPVQKIGSKAPLRITLCGGLALDVCADP